MGLSLCELPRVPYTNRKYTKFRLSNLTGAELWLRRAADGSNYSIIEAGVYTLTDNQLSAPPDGAPFLVVSDLDGTMVGADATTLRFKQYWEAQAVLRGCRLVFSSGRTLVQYLEVCCLLSS